MIASTLAFCLFFLSNQDPLTQAMAASQRCDYETSERILERVKYNSEKRDVYRFYRFLNNFCMNHKREARYYNHLLDDTFDLQLPDRYHVLTALMREEMKQWKDDLGDIARDMKHVRERLQNNYGGKVTQKIQEDIVARLDRMIKQKQDKSKNSSSSDSAKQGKQQPQGTNQPQPPSQPAEDSHIDQIGGAGTVTQQKMRHLTGSWGHLPERERQRLIQELTSRLSPRHREAIENYFKRLAEKSQTR